MELKKPYNLKREAGYWRAFFLTLGRNSTENRHKCISITLQEVVEFN